MRVRTISKEQGERLNIHRFPNFHRTGSVRGMKELYYGKDALLVRCGNYIYNVSSEPDIYYRPQTLLDMRQIVYEGQIACDENGDINFFSTLEPLTRTEGCNGGGDYWYGAGVKIELVDEAMFSDITFESEPIKARIKIEIL